MGIDKKNQVCILIHSGSRGLGHQVATDAVAQMDRTMSKYKIALNDRQLSCAPIFSPEGQDYLKAMGAAANFAWVNRQSMTFLGMICHMTIYFSCQLVECLRLTVVRSPSNICKDVPRYARRSRHACGVRCIAQHRKDRGTRMPPCESFVVIC